MFLGNGNPGFSFGNEEAELPHQANSASHLNSSNTTTSTDSGYSRSPPFNSAHPHHNKALVKSYSDEVFSTSGGSTDQISSVSDLNEAGASYWSKAAFADAEQRFSRISEDTGCEPDVDPGDIDDFGSSSYNCKPTASRNSSVLVHGTVVAV